MNVDSNVLVVAVLLLVVPAVYSTDYYVNSDAGDDVNAGTSSSLPWKTLTAVQNQVWTNYPDPGFLPGDTM